MPPARDLPPQPRFASFADTASTPGGCDARKAFQTRPYRPCPPRSPMPDPNSAPVQISLPPLRHLAVLGRLHNLSCLFTQQSGGHAGNPTMRVFKQFATQKLTIFDESGFGVRKRCNGGKLSKSLQTKYNEVVRIEQATGQDTGVDTASAALTPVSCSCMLTTVLARFTVAPAPTTSSCPFG